MCGGIPYYLERFPDHRPLAEHLLAEVFERTGLLHDEAELMLRQSIRDPANHMAVLRSIAQGHNKNSDIAARTGLSNAQVTQVMTTLERLGLAETLRPITASPRGKKTAYAIADEFLRFHYRFVEPGRSQLRTSSLATTYLNDSVLPMLDHHASLSWERICQEHVLLHVPGVTAVGRWCGQVPAGSGPRTEEREIDVVGIDGTGTPVVMGMCKWTNNEVDFDELNLLDRLAQYVPGHTPAVLRYLFSRTGFSKRITSYAASDPLLRLITPNDIYA